MSRRTLDEKVDDARGAVVDDAAPEDMRARVLARLAEKRGRGGLPGLRLALAAGGMLAVLVVAILSPRQGTIAPTAPPRASSTPSIAALPSALAAPVEAAPVLRADGGPPPLSERVATTSEPSVVVAPMQPPPGLDLSRIDVSPLSIDPLALDELKLEPLPTEGAGAGASQEEE